MRYLNTVYVRSHRARINRSKGSLLIRSDDTTTRVPLEGIDGVVLVGGATMTLDAIAACVERGVRVSVLRRSGAVRWVAGPPVSGNVALRRAQCRASDNGDVCLDLSQRFVAGKLQNSLRVASRWARDSDRDREKLIGQRTDLIADRIGRLPSAPSLDHVRGIEGDAARAHFQCVGLVLDGTGFHFTARSRRPPRDPVNAMLGFCYGLVLTETIGGLEAVGLDPQIGFLHGDRSGRPALALDLVEEFRPMVDRFVVGLFRRRQVGSDHFTITPGGGTYLSDEGRASLFERWEEDKNKVIHHRVLAREVDRWALPGIQATLLARYLRGDIDVYPPFVIPA